MIGRIEQEIIGFFQQGFEMVGKILIQVIDNLIHKNSKRLFWSRNLFLPGFLIFRRLLLITWFKLVTHLNPYPHLWSVDMPTLLPLPTPARGKNNYVNK
jgi:hypothetical protein